MSEGMRCIVTVVSHGVSQCLNGGVDNFFVRQGYICTYGKAN
jgi:hypothetical protein